MSDPPTIILLSGEIASGKSSVCEELTKRHQFSRIRTGGYLQELARGQGEDADRKSLQEIGDQLDQETHGDWVAEIAAKQILNEPEVNSFVLDSIRRDFQIDRFRKRFSDDVLHVHLTAPPEVLEKRFQERRFDDERDSVVSYQHAKDSETERHAAYLGRIADICVNSDTIPPRIIAAMIAVAAPRSQNDLERVR